MHYLLGNQVDPALLKIEPNFGDLLGKFLEKILKEIIPQS